MASINHNLERALRHAERGFRIHPLRPDKRAIVQGWPTVATTDESTIRRWWAQWPNSVPGIATGDWFLVFDRDTKHEKTWRGQYGDKANGRLVWEAEFPKVAVLSMSTPSGGDHLPFRIPRSFRFGVRTFNPIRPGDWDWLPCIDIRGDGGYIALWEDIPQEFPHAPPELLARLVYYQQRHTKAVASVVGDGRIPDGARNDTLFRMGCSMRRFGASEELIRTALHQHNEAACDPPLTERDIVTIAKSIGTRYTPEALSRYDVPLGDGRRLLMTLDELMSQPYPQYLVDRVIPERAVGSLFGPTGTYKSFIALDIALSVAAGLDWQGHKTVQGPVIYIAGEGGLGIRKRVEAWRIQNKQSHDTLKQCFFPLVREWKADDKEHVQTLLEDIDAVNIQPVLIVVDTLSTSMTGDENLKQDVQKLLDGLRKFVNEGASVLVLHHTGYSKAAANRERGTSAFPANSDFRIQVQKQEPLKTRLMCRKMKDDEEFKSFDLLLEVVPVGADRDGVEVTSLAIVGTMATDAKPDGLSDSLKQVLAALYKLGGSTKKKDWQVESGRTDSSFDKDLAALRKSKLVYTQAKGHYAVSGAGAIALLGLQPIPDLSDFLDEDEEA